MNKNITVLDESGNEIGATYFKRARGLVKKGRARFVSETAIRLACPPNQKDEEDKMLDAIEKVVDVISDATDRIGSGAGFKVSESAAMDKQEEAAATDQASESAAMDKQEEAAATDQASESAAADKGTVDTAGSQMSDSPADPVKEKARLLEKLIDMCQQVAISNDYSADEFSDIVNGILDTIRHL